MVAKEWHLSQFGIMAYGNLVIEVGCGEIIIKTMYDIAQSAVLLEGLKSKSFNIGRVVRVVICLLSCMYFPISC